MKRITRKKTFCKISLALNSIVLVSSLLITSSAGALNESPPVQQDYGVDDTESLAITSEGKWAKKYAVEMLELYPDLQTNPYTILARFNESATNQQITDLLGEINAEIVEYFADSDLYLLETVAGNINARHFLYGSALVEFVDFDETVSADDLTNDPRISELWGLTGDHGIGASVAWENTSGANEVVVAVIDSGVDTTHPDLANVIWQNPNEIAGNGIDDDGNGFVDDLNGWDFVYDDNQPEDGNGHGTHVSGTIAAVRNNALGVAGVANNVKIMPLRFLDSNGSGYISNAISALNYAIANGAPISNNSWGGGGYSSSLHAVIGVANRAGHTFVAAAGNEGSNIDSVPSYPAAYDNDNVISVAAIDDEGKLASFSNYGLSNVDIAAPGVSIVSTVSHQSCSQPSGADCYASLQGTSMAAPHVAGVVALILGIRPGSTPYEISQILRDSARTTSVLNGKVSFGGELDAAAAVTLASVTGSISFPVHTDGELIFKDEVFLITAQAVQSNGTDVSAAVNWKDNSGNNLGTGATLTYSSNALGVFRLVAEAQDSTGITLRSVATFTITERVFEFITPLQLLVVDSGEMLQADWTWEGPAEETADLLMQSVSFDQVEGVYPMPDIEGQDDLSEFTFEMLDTGDVEDVLLGIRLDHTYVADLNISLVHPDGTQVLLAKRDGGRTEEYGYGNGDANCEGNLSYFTDSAAESISDRPWPYVGVARPRESLSAFDGKPIAGNWTLRILDDWDEDEGTLYCAELLLGTTSSQTITLSDDEQLSTGSYDWQSDAPTNVVATPRNGQAAVTFVAPMNIIPDPILANTTGTYRIGFTGTSLGDAWGCCLSLIQSPAVGDSTTTSYTVTASPGGRSCSGVGACMVTGLTNGTAYTFTVVATNKYGDSAPSVASNTVTPTSIVTVSDAPTNVVATPGNGQAAVTFVAPINFGGSTITSYTVTASPGGQSCTGGGACMVTGLTNGTAYTFTVAATNKYGDSAFSAWSNSATPDGPTVSDAPTNVVATPGNGQAAVTFVAPINFGGSTITSYTVTASPGGRSCTGVGACMVTGLTNGTAYTFTVVATNNYGNSAPSVASSPVTPDGPSVSDAPTNVVATPGNGQAAVTFVAPINFGGSTITSYTVTASPGGRSCTGGGACMVTGLTNGTAYTFTVVATNNYGNSAPSVASSPVTPDGPSVSDAPTNVVATPGNGQAAVTFVAPINFGGSTITSYTVTASPGGRSCTGGGACMVTGLTNGTAYTFTVVATNNYGNSVPSVASSPVTL